LQVKAFLLVDDNIIVFTASSSVLIVVLECVHTSQPYLQSVRM